MLEQKYKLVHQPAKVAFLKTAHAGTSTFLKLKGRSNNPIYWRRRRGEDINHMYVVIISLAAAWREKMDSWARC